jgi:trehalose-6-phosphatase
MKTQLMDLSETETIGMATSYDNNTAPLFHCWEEISIRVRAAQQLQIFLDFDGTLVPYSPRPEQVRLEEETELALRKLVAHSNVHVTIVSGRRRAVLMRYLKIPGLKFMGLYGWESEGKVSLPSRRVLEISGLRKILRHRPLEAP